MRACRRVCPRVHVHARDVRVFRVWGEEERKCVS